MKRSAAQIGLTSFSVLAAAFYLSATITAMIMAVSAVSAVLFLLIKKTRKTVFLPLIAVTAALSCGLNLLYTAWAVDPVINNFRGENKRIEAVLTDESYQQYNKYYYPLKARSIDGEPVGTKILLKTGKPLDIEPFDSIIMTADITPTENDYYKAKGYYITVNALDISYTSAKVEERPLYYHIIALRQAMRGALDDLLPQDEADLCKAVLIGDKYALDISVRDDFRYSGASYFIVVSGMHFSVICLLSFWLFKRLFRKRWLYFPLTYLVIILYMFLTGCQPSVVRAGVMILILVTGRLVRRQSDPISSLGIAGLCMPLFFSPYGCGDIGMILSFSATFSIIMWQTPVYEKLRIRRTGKHRASKGLINAVNTVISVFSVSLAANILVLPLSVFLFNGFSTMTLLSAMLLYPLIWLTMMLALFVCLFYYLGPLKYLALLISWPLYGVAKLTLFLVSVIASIPFAYIRIRTFWVYLWVGITLAMGLTAYCLRKKIRLYSITILLSAVLFLTGCIGNTIVQLNIDVLQIDPGESGAAVYLDRHGCVDLLRFDTDSSTAYRMIYQLTDHYGGVDLAVCSDYQERVNYSRMTDKEFPVNNYLMYGSVPDVFDSRSADETFSGDAVFVIDDGLILSTVEDDERELLYLSDDGVSVMLIPTNFSYDAIPDDMRTADIIIMNKAVDNYDRLSCDTLYYCGDASAVSNDRFPKHQTLLDARDARISLDMKSYGD